LPTANVEASLLLKNRCGDKSLGYWTFKVCVGSAIRQTHEAEVIQVGAFEPDLDDKAREAQPLTAVQRFTNGDTCLDGAPRSALVTYSCNRNSDALSVDSVVEGPTCHYNIGVSSFVLCASSLFALPEPKPDDLLCFPVE